MDIFCGNVFYDFMWTLESKKEIVRFCHELLQNFCITRVFLFAKIWNTVELSSNIFCRIFYSISCLPWETQLNFGVLFAPNTPMIDLFMHKVWIVITMYIVNFIVHFYLWFNFHCTFLFVFSKVWWYQDKGKQNLNHGLVNVLITMGNFVYLW